MNHGNPHKCTYYYRVAQACRPDIFLLLLLFLAFLPAARAEEAAPFFLNDGDTVVFYGDSITEQQDYTRDIETYVITHYPQWRVKFINSGWNGDRVSGGEGGSIETRLARDVFAYHPTVVTVLLGMNDGDYTHYSAATYDRFTQGLTQIVDALQRQTPPIRITLLTPTMYDENAPGSRHFQGYNQVLLRYGAFVKKLGAERNILVVDLNAPMHAATEAGRRRDRRFTLSWDGVHPGQAGQLIIASEILHAWHADGTATELKLDPAQPVTAVTLLPWPIPPRARPAFSLMPLPSTLDTFRVWTTALRGARYDLLVDGKPVATATRQELENGLDLTLYPDLPQNAQSAQVLGVVQERLDRWRYLWKGGPDAIAHPNDTPNDPEITALNAIDHWLDEYRDRAYATAQPATHVFSLRLTVGRVASASLQQPSLTGHIRPEHRRNPRRKQP